jgi:hypothetical protein
VARPRPAAAVRRVALAAEPCGIGASDNDDLLQGNNIPNFGDTRKSHRQIMTINEIHVFTPNTVNEVRLGYNRIRIDFSPNAALNPADIGMNIGITSAIGLPQISFRLPWLRGWRQMVTFDRSFSISPKRLFEGFLRAHAVNGGLRPSSRRSA